MSPEPERYPSTDDSAESLKIRPTSPVNRNWNWSPRAPGSIHIIEHVIYGGDNHPLHSPYEKVESSEEMLETESNDDESKYGTIEDYSDDDLTEEMKQEILKERGFDTWKEFKDARRMGMGMALAAMRDAPKIKMTAEEFHKLIGL